MNIIVIPPADKELEEAVDGQDILITCVAHQHRNPTYYLERIE